VGERSNWEVRLSEQHSGKRRSPRDEQCE
jgi:hypothetical protein